MFTRYMIVAIAVFLFSVVFADAEYVMARIDQNGDIIDGPVAVNYVSNDICKISDLGYIYYISEYGGGICVYSSSLVFVNYADVYTYSLCIDNVRSEIVAGREGTITRFGPTLDELVTFNTDGVHGLTVDQDDGAIWYTYGGLYKLAHDGAEIYNDINDYSGFFTDVSPIGSFWLNSAGFLKDFGNPRLFDSDGTYRAQANMLTSRIVFEMHFASEAC